MIAGRALPFSFDRTYRSQSLGYGQLGGASWSANVFAHLREIETTGEVEYHDGAGHVWRFIPSSAVPSHLPEGYERDDVASYYVPQGVYLRLQKYSGTQGWRLIGRHHDIARFDGAGRLTELSDRHRQGQDASQLGNTLVLRYDFSGQLIEVEDDLGRRYSFKYYEDPRPVTGGGEDSGDGARYGLLKKPSQGRRSPRPKRRPHGSGATRFDSPLPCPRREFTINESRRKLDPRKGRKAVRPREMIDKPVQYIADELSQRLERYGWALRKHGIQTMIGSLSSTLNPKSLVASSTAGVAVYVIAELASELRAAPRRSERPRGVGKPLVAAAQALTSVQRTPRM